MRISDWSPDVCSSDLCFSSKMRVERQCQFIDRPPPVASQPELGKFQRVSSRKNATRLDLPRRGIKPARDRKSVVPGTIVSVRVDLGGRRIMKKKTPGIETMYARHDTTDKTPLD